MHAHHYGIDLHARHKRMPPGFRRRRKGEKTCPYPSSAFIELLIKTPEGYGSAGVTRARQHDWPSLPPEVVGDRALSLDGSFSAPEPAPTEEQKWGSLGPARST